ncbi:hypothetical protein NFIA_010310 [Paecilomyces variotii No. 5]|uniref:SRm160/300 splicing coactivator n=1 Tax=Byssochlamys spectabilis (strain No. 5 / NBRC 109023) TaxID=1356009 RepID=V5FBY7_BYSSN|nr:hypothetical protein NFIA_010310 [Paecilomyces variotii No. 5]
MPSPAPARRSSYRGGVTKSTPAKSKAPDIGKPLGIYDTNSVREKIRQWQQQGGGVVTANDVLANEDEENLPKSKIEEPTKTTPHKTVTRLKEEDDESNADSRKRSNSAPRKRVISDEHWKIKRSAPKTPPAKTRPPKRITVYKTNDEFVASPGTKKGDRKSDTSKSRVDDDGIRIYATPPSSRKQSKQTKHADDETSKIESRLDDDASSVDHTPSTISKKRDSPKTPKDKHRDGPETKRSTILPEDDDNEWAPSEANFSELSRRRARGPINDTRRPPPKIHKGGIFGHMLDESKKMFARPEPPPPAPTRGAKIEAWLSNTPDPFMEDDGSDVEIPAPLKTRSSRKEPPQGQELKADEPSQKSPGSSGSRRRRSTHVSRSHRKDECYMSETDNLSSRESLSAIAEEAAQTARRKSDTSSSSTIRRAAAHKRSQSASRIGKDSPRRKGEGDEKESHPDTESLPFSDGSEVSASDAPFPLNTRRPFPSTGVHRLSTIPSVETLKTQEEPQSQTTKSTREPEKEGPKTDGNDDSNLESEERDSFDPNSLPGSSSGLKRRLTTHEDLMSVLSEPRTRNRSTRSTRSIRSNRSRRLANTTMDDLMQELSSDETKYMRELRTLVGGVIPVLLTCVLSRSDSAIAAGLFRPSLDPKDDMNFTKPIVDMGVALERLKSMHKRIPLDNPDALLTWAQGAQRVYRDYLKAWRLGFQDVVVNLAPPEEDTAEPNSDTKSLDQGMERDESGDIVNADGQKVDVAYLLKRPLVRLKYLSKTFRGINTLKHSPKAEEIATAYQTLVTDARRRSNEERARLEDESAASIDPTRARDPRTLAALSSVSVDQTRRVRARDFFDLSLHHSSGQMVDCRSELLLRDNAPDNGAGGDLLICEVDNSDRWLLFPPIDISCVSARSGDAKGELVVMIRSPPGEKRGWRELLNLVIDDGEIGTEWIHMLGEDPLPPPICRTQSFIARSKEHHTKSHQERSSDTSPKQKLTPNPSEIDIPIGEQASRPKRRSISPKELLSEPSTLSYSSAAKSGTSLYSAITRESDYNPAVPESSPKAHEGEDVLISKCPAGLKRSKAKRVSRHIDNLPSSPASRMSTTPERDVVSPPSQKHDRYYGAKEATKSPEPATAVHEKHGKEKPSRSPVVDDNRQKRTRVSSVPSMDLPTIRKVRKGTQSHNTSLTLSTDEDDLDDFSDISDAPNATDRSKKDHSASDDLDDAPAPPPHRSPSTAQLKQQSIPVLSPTAGRQRRRSSSPLKHEYEPSTASDTASDTASEYSETSTVMHYDMDSEYSSSETSDDELEDDDIPTPLPPAQRQKPQKDSVPSPIPTLPSESLDPSNSASQGPYRTVPLQPEKSSKAIASIFGWSDKGTWENLFPDECSITVTPGLIEAFEMSAAHSNPEAFAHERPLIALELTPLVPIRRGTAIDISIRSPPTERSKIKSNNNIMFRSRSTEECEALYAMINHARINNPTYIALQNARGPFAGQPASLERYNSTRSNKGGGWFSWPKRRNSYRASGTPRSLAEGSESSVGTMSSAFSALKRFGTGSKMFSIARSTITSRTGSKGDSLYSSEAGSGAKAPGSGLAGLAGAIKGVDGIGLSNAKIRLYLRESQSKWRDLGAARLTIMPASPAPSRPQTSGGTPEEGNMASESSDSSRPPSVSAPRREMTTEKRIIVRGKTRGEIILDVCLGESAFERVARTGIAVSVWEENEGGTVAKEGGVTGGSFKIFMIQMKTEAETAYTFGLVGKLRY